MAKPAKKKKPVGKAGRRELAQPLKKARARAAAMAAATRGRARVFEDEDKRKAVPPARKQIEQQLKDAKDETA